MWLADTRSETLRPLTAEVAEESSPDVSPDGTKIIFNSGGVDYDLVVVPLDGSPVRDLLATSRKEHSAFWVAGTDQFVYISDRSGQEEIRIRSNSEDWDRPLISPRDFPMESTQILRDPVVSPDGHFLAFDRKAVKGPRSIWISPINGGAPARLTTATGNEAVPAWSPDGSWLAYLVTEGGVLQLASSRVGGSAPPQMLVTDVSLMVAPEWSPTGEWIACANREGVELISPDGKRRRLLPKVRASALLWSRDGSLIYTVGPREAGGSQLLSMDISTGVVKVVSAFAPNLVFSTGMNPGLRFSMAADGKSFLASVRRLRTDLWILDGFNQPSGLLSWFHK
jgi:Tol biopolymer transport system component